MFKSISIEILKTIGEIVNPIIKENKTSEEAKEEETTKKNPDKDSSKE